LTFDVGTIYAQNIDSTLSIVPCVIILAAVLLGHENDDDMDHGGMFGRCLQRRPQVTGDYANSSHEHRDARSVLPQVVERLPRRLHLGRGSNATNVPTLRCKVAQGLPGWEGGGEVKYHAPHPTQSHACGAVHTATGMSEEEFRAAMVDDWKSRLLCKRCLKVILAGDAGRPVFAGYDDGAGDRGQRLAKDAMKDKE
jgi:hypothetical protein